MLPVESVVDPRVGVCPDIWCQVDGLRLGRHLGWTESASPLIIAKAMTAREAVGLPTPAN